MTEAEILVALDDRHVLALTMWAEASGDRREGRSSVEERIAVGCVVRNRLPAWQRYRASAQTWKAVCLAPKQFSCWTPAGGAANYARLMAHAEGIAQRVSAGDALYRETLYLADGIIAGTILDRTGGATLYWAPAAMVPPGRIPSWAVGRDPVAIGAQLFLSDTALPAAQEPQKV